MDVIKVNARGLDWPYPLVKLKDALVNAKLGQILELEFTCPEATSTLPLYCEENNIEILNYIRLDDSWQITLKK